jgi:hypothetical protein
MKKKSYVQNTSRKLKAISSRLPVVFHVIKPLGEASKDESKMPTSAPCIFFNNQNMFCINFYKSLSKVI